MSERATPLDTEDDDPDDPFRDAAGPVCPDLPPRHAMPTDAEANIIPTDSPGG